MRPAQAGYRVIAYDRRGFGQSSKPTTGYDYDTLAADLAVLIDHLDLGRPSTWSDSPMGTGEVIRYLGSRGSARVRKAVLLGALPPFLLKTDHNPQGVDGQVFDRIKAALAADRFAYLETFLNDSYNADVLGGTRISDQAWYAAFIAALAASAHATCACVTAGSPTSGPTCARSTSPPSSSTAPMTGSCPSPRPRNGCPASSTTSGWSPSTTGRTTSPGPTRTRLTQPCSASWPSDGSPSPTCTSHFHVAVCGPPTANDTRNTK